MPKKIAFVFDENSKNDVSSDDIDELIELSDGRYIVIPKLQGAIECSPTQRAADGLHSCLCGDRIPLDEYRCSNCREWENARR